MSITYQQIRNERQWRASTGLSESQFHKLVSSFKQTYEEFLGEGISDGQKALPNERKFQTYEDLLFFILYSIKSGLTYDLLALSFNLDRATAFRYQSFGIRILEMTLEALDYLPKRFFEDLDEFQTYMSSEDQLLLDASEQKRQRPQNQQDQKKTYSGKKKPTRSKP